MTPLIMFGAILAIFTLLPVCVGVGLANRRLRAQLEQANRPVKPSVLSWVRPVRSTALAAKSSPGSTVKVLDPKPRWQVVEPEQIEVGEWSR